MLDEARAYINQRLQIAGSNGEMIFEPESVDLIYRYSGGIPRVVNMLCEHALVSSFVDQHRTVSPGVIEAVARDFDLHESGTPDGVTQAVVPANPEKLDVVEALRTLATLADRLRRPETELSKEGKI
jgi:type II secretory pathway predicted ATPase ExeA